MFNNGIHYKDNSLLDKSNPFLKLILTVLFILATLIAKSTIAHIFLLSFLLILLFSTSIPIKRFLKAVWLTRYLLIIVIVIDALIFRSLTHTLIATLSFISIVIMISLMLMTTKAQDLMLTLEVVFMPFKIFGFNPRKMALKVIKFITVLTIMSKESKNMLKAIKNRNESENLSNNIANLKAKKEPLILKSIAKADQYIDVMKVRNYNFNAPGSHTMSVRNIDYAIVSVQILLFISILIKG